MYILNVIVLSLHSIELSVRPRMTNSQIRACAFYFRMSCSSATHSRVVRRFRCDRLRQERGSGRRNCRAGPVCVGGKHTTLLCDDCVDVVWLHNQLGECVTRGGDKVAKTLFWFTCR